MTPFLEASLLQPRPLVTGLCDLSANLGRTGKHTQRMFKEKGWYSAIAIKLYQIALNSQHQSSNVGNGSPFPLNKYLFFIFLLCSLFFSECI